MNQLHRLAGKEPGGIASGNGDPPGDVVGSFAQLQLLQRAAQCDPLFELAEIRLIELLAQLRLSGEHDGQQLLLVGLDVRKQADLLEELARQGVSFVHN